MTRAGALVARLESMSDWLSPIVVKEVRQIVRGREFAYSFGASLVASLTVAFFGAADALTGSGTTGSWTFYALTVCLALLGFGVVPLGAFSALRNERIEQTLELITLTQLSPRRIVIGKLLAQGVKLATLFAAVAPFVAMSFLLGGIDFLTIIVTLVAVFMWSLWTSALCLFLSTLMTSRVMSSLIFVALGIGMFVLFNISRSLYFFATRGMMGMGGPPGFAGSTWWLLGIAMTFCLASLVNLVLLAENRLSLATEDKVTGLRVGFLVQLLLLGAWLLFYLDGPPRIRGNVIASIGVVGGLHLALVAIFTISEDLVLARRTRLREKVSTLRTRLLAMFLPGGGRGAIYVLVQMALLLAFAQLFDPTPEQRRWLLAVCGYILFFTGVPACVFRGLRPERQESLKVRIAILAGIPAMLVLPDLLHYLLWRPDVLNLKFTARHLFNPFRTLANWRYVEGFGWTAIPLLFGLTGLVAYGVLIFISTRAVADADESDSRDARATSEESGRAGVLY